MIPFRQWFAYGVSSLGLSPEDFWALTLDEWRALLPEAAPAMTRAGLEALIAQYPDMDSGFDAAHRLPVIPGPAQPEPGIHSCASDDGPRVLAFGEPRGDDGKAPAKTRAPSASSLEALP